MSEGPFIVFAYNDYEAAGGANDIVAVRNNMADADLAARWHTRKGYSCIVDSFELAHIYDVAQRKTVKSYKHQFPKPGTPGTVCLAAQR